MATVAPITRRTVSATEARIHFGEMIERVVGHAEVVVVERHGRPAVAVVPLARLDELERIEATQPRRSMMDIIEESHAYVRAHLGEDWMKGVDIDEMIDGGRDDVD